MARSFHIVRVSLLVAIALLVAEASYALQSDPRDSLKALLKTSLKQKQRIDVLNALSYNYYDFNDSIAHEYAEQALEEAKGIGYTEGLQYAFTLVGIWHFTIGEYPLALSYFTKSDSLSKNASVNHTVYNLMLMGNVLADLGQYDSAQLKYERGLTLIKATKGHRYASGILKGYARLKMYQWQNDKALHFINEAARLRTMDNDYQKRDLYVLWAQIHLNLNNFEQTEFYLNKFCQSIQNSDDEFHKGMCHYIRAEWFYKQGELNKALLEGFKVFELTKVYDYHLLRAQVYTLMGELYSQLSDYKVASDFFYKALKITEADGLMPISAEIYNELAWVYKDQANYDLALQFVDRSQAMREKIKDQRGIAACYNVRGLIYMLQNKIDASIEEHTKALAIRQKLDYNEGISASLYNMSLSYEKIGMLEKALQLQEEALAIDNTINNRQSLGISYNGVAALYIKLGKIQEAREALAQVKLIAGETGSRLLLKNYYANQADFSEIIRDYKAASYYRKKQVELSDSLYSESSVMKLAEMQALYQVERKEQEIELLSKQKDFQANELALQRAQLRNQNLIIVLGVLLFIVLSGFAFFVYNANRKLTKAKMNLAEVNEELSAQSEELKESNDSLISLNNLMQEKQKEIQAQSEELTESNKSLLRLNVSLQEKQEEVATQAEELREANETISSINQNLEQKVEERTQQLKQAYNELDTFFYRSSHDFRRPITTFMGLSEVAAITVKDNNALELFDKVKETAQSLDKMIRKLQSISDVGGQELVIRGVLLREIIENILIGFQHDIEKKQIKIIKSINISKPFDSYPALVSVVIENLIENAIQFSSPISPYIKISADDYIDRIVISIEDNGQGIAEEYHNRIFDMYFRANVSSKGNGLGLYIVKKAVDKLNARISFTTRNNQGSTFIVDIPSVY